ncbi:MAG: type I-C CRISPR-associated protein Cas7/Csd2 [Dehalococcoidia bacterium]
MTNLTSAPASTPVAVRYDFVLLFDVQDGNPNGDPDAGNMPRIDPETNNGLVTDVCLKRKIRDFVYAAHDGEPGYRIYVQHQSRGGRYLNDLHLEAQNAIGITGPAASDARKNPPPAQREQARKWMCRNFFDVRAFGAVMSTGVNAGQVRGPVQITFARSIDPVVPTEYAITRVAKTTEERAQAAGSTEIGRKYTLPYGLYCAHGFVSASFARDTGFSDDDLQLLWEALTKMFWDDHSATRGQMDTRGLYAFRHSSPLGEAPAYKLFERITVRRREGIDPARSFGDYEVLINDVDMPRGVELLRLVS